MSVGTITRRTLGPLFPVAGAAYRRVFVDIRKVAAAVPALPNGSLILDVGGGDGALLNPLLEIQPALRAALVDIAPNVGGFLRDSIRARVSTYPSMSLRDYITSGGEVPTAVLMADVFHHVDPAIRLDVIHDVFDVFADQKPIIVVKDIEPEGLRAKAAFWADRYISGDRNVVPVRQSDLVKLFRDVSTDLVAASTTLFDDDHPNYCVVLSLP